MPGPTTSTRIDPQQWADMRKVHGDDAVDGMLADVIAHYWSDPDLLTSMPVELTRAVGI